MLFTDFPLFEAIYEVRQEMVASGESPGEEAWYVDSARREEFCRRVILQMTRDCDQAIINAALTFRKCAKAEGTDLKKLDLLVEVARTHGRKCFYGNRGLGACSEDVHLDRLIPGSKGGVYSVENCVIACGYHNTSRNDIELGEFLRSGSNLCLVK